MGEVNQDVQEEWTPHTPRTREQNVCLLLTCRGSETIGGEYSEIYRNRILLIHASFYFVFMIKSSIFHVLSIQDFISLKGKVHAWGINFSSFKPLMSSFTELSLLDVTKSMLTSQNWTQKNV